MIINQTQLTIQSTTVRSEYSESCSVLHRAFILFTYIIKNVNLLLLLFSQPTWWALWPAGYKFIVYCLSWQRTKSQAWFLLIDHDDITEALQSDLQSLQVGLCSFLLAGLFCMPLNYSPFNNTRFKSYRLCGFFPHISWPHSNHLLPCNLHALLLSLSAGNIWIIP